MDRSTAPLALLLVVPAIAGCLAGSPPTPTTPAEAAPSALDETFDLETTPMTGPVEPGNGSIFRIEATSAGTVAGTRLTVPEGAPMRIPRHPGLYAFLDVVPLVREEDRDAVKDWAVLAFTELTDEEVAIQGFASPRIQTVQKVGPAIENPETVPPTFLPGRAVFPAQAGDEIPIVLAANTTRPVEIGVALRFVGSLPEGDLPDDPEDIVGKMTDRAPLAEAPTLGQGRGFEIGLYLDLNGFAVFGLEAWTDSVTVEDEAPVDPRPAASTRQLSLSYDFPTDDGWGFGQAIEWATVETSDWSVEADFHGETMEASGVSVNAAAARTDDLTGVPFYFGVGGGEGGTHGRLDTTMVTTGTVMVTNMAHIDLGEPLETLIDDSGPSMALLHEGLLSADRTVRLDLDDERLTLTGPGTRITFLGPWSDGGPERLP